MGETVGGYPSPSRCAPMLPRAALLLATVGIFAHAQSVSVSSSISATPLPVNNAQIKFSESWSYLDTGVSLAPGTWNQPGYDDSAWATGRTPAGASPACCWPVLVPPGRNSHVVVCVVRRLRLRGHSDHRKLWSQCTRALHYDILSQVLRAGAGGGPKVSHRLPSWLPPVACCTDKLPPSSPSPPLHSYTGVLQCNVGDGAVVYVNGVEVGRPGMPTGPFNSSTLALTPIYILSTVSVVKTVTIPDNLLFNGWNVVAVEVRVLDILFRVAVRQNAVQCVCIGL